MKKFCLLVGFFGLIFSLQVWAQRIDIVIDLDDTLVQVVDKGDKLSEIYPKHRLMEVGDYKYIFFDGSDEFVKYLLRNKDVVITFFSNGTRERNEKLIEQWIPELFGQERAKELKNRINVLSRDHTANGERDETLQPPPPRFYGNRKKDLRVVGGDLNWTVLIDDDVSYTVRGQERNLLKVTGYNSFFAGTYMSDDIVRSRNHFMYALGVLLTSLHNAEKNKTTLVDELHAIQFDDSEEDAYGCYGFYHKPNQEIFYQMGLKALKEINPNLELFLPKGFDLWNKI